MEDIIDAFVHARFALPPRAAGTLGQGCKALWRTPVFEQTCHPISHAETLDRSARSTAGFKLSIDNPNGKSATKQLLP